MRYLALAVLFCFCSVLETRAGRYFFDDFDGNPVHTEDGEPVKWSAGAFGKREIDKGDLVLSTTTTSANGPPTALVALDLYEDISIRTKLQLDERISYAAVLARWTGAAQTYVAWVDPSGVAGITRWHGSMGPPQVIGSVPVDGITAPNDANLQFDLFGDQLSLSVWPDGSQRPHRPQLTLSDATHTSGDKVGVGMTDVGPSGPATHFRFYETASQPWDPFSIVVPSEFTDVDAPNVADFLPEEYRLQQLYLDEEFLSVSSNYLITGARWRTDAALDVPSSASAEQWIARMSTTPRKIGELDPAFAENPGDDVTVVFDGPVSWEVTHDEARDGLGEFAFALEFQKAFPYNPEQGNLLFDLTVLGGSERLGMDFSVPPTATTQLIWTGFDGDGTTPHASGDPWGGHVVEYIFASADCNGNGLVDLRDANCSTPATVDATLALAGLIPGDVDGNGTVEFEDFLILSGNFGSPGDYTEGNLDRNDEVGFADFLILSTNFGMSSAHVAAVPEPSAWALGTLALVALASIRGPRPITAKRQVGLIA